MNIIHFSDTHLGVTTHGKTDSETGMNTQVLDFLESLDMVCDYVEEIQADLVVFSGDAYHYHSPSPTYVSLFAARIQRISNICPIVLIPGNHDKAASREASAVDVFGRVDIPNVYTTDKPRGFTISIAEGEVYVGCMPWPTRRHYVTPEDVRGLSKTDAKALYMSNVGDYIRDMAKDAAMADFAILIAHLTVAGCAYGSEHRLALGMDSEVLYEQVADPVWDYVALGHIHHFQDLSKGKQGRPPVVYAGNIDRITFIDEGHPKGFVHVSIGEETTYTFIDVDARPMLTIHADLTDEYSPNEALLQRLRDQDFQGDEIVRIVVDVNFPTDINDVEVIDYLEQQTFVVAGITKNVLKRKAVRLEGEDLRGTSMPDVLDLYFQEQEVDDDEIDKLLDLFEEVSEDVEV